jgi:aminomethyltransferase
LIEAGVSPAGLGARDTLRLEAGLPLHGHELGAGITPLQAGLGWVVSWDKGPFRGKEALAVERERGPHRRLRGLLGATRRPPRALDRCLQGGETVGVVSSGNFSPVLERGIALAFLAPTIDLDDEIVVDVRGSALPTTVVKPPFQTLRERGVL